jgi:hypothetical protein
MITILQPGRKKGNGTIQDYRVKASMGRHSKWFELSKQRRIGSIIGLLKGKNYRKKKTTFVCKPSEGKGVRAISKYKTGRK